MNVDKPITSYQRQINAVDSWDSGLSGEGVRIAVIDTGFDSNSETVDNYRLLSVGSSGVDTFGHGTQMTNIIAGDPGYYFGGIAPNSEVLSIKASIGNTNTFSQNDLANAVNLAVSQEVAIISMALSYDGVMNSVLFNSLKNASNLGIEIIVSAGNSYDNDILFWNGLDVHVVGSIGRDGLKSEFSQVGEDLDIYAPGEQIATVGLNNHVEIIKGTSPAEAIVAGSIALMLEAGKDPSEIYNYVFPVIDETVGQINIGFATHTTGEALLHHWQNADALTISYLIPPQNGVYDVKVYIEHNSTTYDLNSNGNFIKNFGGGHLVSFDDLPSNYELIGNLFGYLGIYEYIDVSSVSKGVYTFKVELVDQSDQLVQIIGQEIVVVL